MASAGTSLSQQQPPLCVDLDGTLIHGDSLVEHVLALVRNRPFLVVLLPFWLLRGRAYFKSRLSSAISIDPASFSYRSAVVDFLHQERSKGRRLVLVTAADQSIANAVSAHLGLFAEAHGSTASFNLKGGSKAERLVQLFGDKSFDYIGDSSADLAVWRRARRAHVVGSRTMRARAANAAEVGEHFVTSRPSFLTILRSIRVHHWSKNFLIFLPLVLAHRTDLAAWRASGSAFLLFGLCASGLYVINDLLDLHSDRAHPSKKHRPFASGELPLAVGALGSILLVSLTLAASFFLNTHFAMVLVGYALLTMLYSSVIKKYVLADVFVLASFYGIRIFAGAEISGTALSQWFLVFSGFFFLSLAMAKRSSELMNAKEQVASGNSRRGYRVEDRDLVSIFGVASSFCCVVILALYAHSPEVTILYRRPGVLLLICPIVLYWLSRIWLLAHRGELDYDPVTFALRDRTSQVLGLLCLAVLIAANLRFA